MSRMDQPQPKPTPHRPAQRPLGAPLAGVRVLDLTRLLPGPLATLHLADLGADVIKIEDPAASDGASPAVRALVNRNKRGLQLDLKQPAGVATLVHLCRSADVLIEGFRPGVMQRLGLGYEVLAQANPRLVVCSLSGWGQTGPLRDLPGHDLNYAAMTGVTDQTAGLSNLPMADLLGGTMVAVMGILAALFDATRTGFGRHVDVAIADGVLAHAVLPLAALNQSGQVQPLGAGTLTGALACYGRYATADGRELAVGALEPKFWRTLCQRLQRPDLAELHRSGNPSTEAQLRATLVGVFGSQPLAHWTTLFADAPACVTPVLRLDEALAHPHFVARGMAAGVEGRTRHALPTAVNPRLHPTAPAPAPATTRHLGCPVHMTGFQSPAPRSAPQPGEHSAQVLAQAGLTPQAVAALRAAGVLG
jgi:alpha-methylacyl-CoA racemase